MSSSTSLSIGSKLSNIQETDSDDRESGINSKTILIYLKHITQLYIHIIFSDLLCYRIIIISFMMHINEQN